MFKGRIYSSLYFIFFGSDITIRIFLAVILLSKDFCENLNLFIDRFQVRNYFGY